MLSINNACKSFGQIEILKNVTIKISEGVIIGLAGASGSGKSTLLRAIQGFEKLDSGTINHSGSTGFMFQDFQLFGHMTILENVTYAPKMILKDPQHEEKAMKILSSIGMGNKLYSYPRDLSGGQKQRVALARTIILEPKIILCDEPTSGLDVATIDDIIKLLKSVHKMRMSMVIASHDLDFLTKIASRIIVLKSGNIVGDVDPSEDDAIVDRLKMFY